MYIYMFRAISVRPIARRAWIRESTTNLSPTRQSPGGISRGWSVSMIMVKGLSNLHVSTGSSSRRMKEDTEIHSPGGLDGTS